MQKSIFYQQNNITYYDLADYLYMSQNFNIFDIAFSIFIQKTLNIFFYNFYLIKLIVQCQWKRAWEHQRRTPVYAKVCPFTNQKSVSVWKKWDFVTQVAFQKQSFANVLQNRCILKSFAYLEESTCVGVFDK